VNEKLFWAITAVGVPNLLVIILGKLFYSQDPERGTLRNVTYKDIFVTGKPIGPSSFAGYE
jgi:hypothetical protein